MKTQNWVPDRLFKKLVALFYLCYGPMWYKMHIILLL